jgi:type II secretory pathway component PulF
MSWKTFEFKTSKITKGTITRVIVGIFILVCVLLYTGVIPVTATIFEGAIFGGEYNWVSALVLGTITFVILFCCCKK